jgi:hypothetical protein
MHFFGKKYTVIENKVIIPKGFVRKSKEGHFITLLFSGTLAESTGVFQAIDLAIKLHALEEKIRLQIIGYSAQPATLQKIQEAIEGYTYIQLIGGDHLISHPQIVKEIESADFGIICYPPSAHTENSMPTKLYEYSGFQLPILLQNHPPWVAFCSTFNGAIPVDFERIEAAKILQKMKGSFYTTPAKDVTWEDEKDKLIAAVGKMNKLNTLKYFLG